jgi:ABC-2 type transport system permease protein
MFAIYKRELAAYFNTPIGYIFCAVFLALSGAAFSYTTLFSMKADVTSYFTYLLVMQVVLIPLLTMKLFSEERKQRTEQLLLTAPVTITGMVMGKFLAALTVFGGSLLVSCINFIPIYAIADAERAGQSFEFYHIGPVTGELVGNLVGLLLIGAAFIALGTFISALTENQLAAAVITISVIVLMLGIGLLNSFINVYWLRTVLSWISISPRFGNFQNGLFDFAAILYYASICFIFVFLTIRVYEKRRWN